MSAPGGELVVEALSKRFGDPPHAKVVLDGVSFSAPKGEIVALLGPSGSGKTTLLRIVAGFETADSGAIRWGGERVDTLPPEKRDFGMVFQHYALFPHMSVGENVAFGLEARKVPKRDIAERVAAALSRVDLSGFEKRRVGEISGGQQQRVALARALAPEPRALLLDEPLSNLDPTLRERTRRKLQEVLRRLGITTVLVTHEQEEAFDLAQRVAVLWGGELQQVGAPEELHERPANRTVAAFVGRANFLRGLLRRGPGGGWEVAFADGIAWPGELVDLLPPLQEGDEAELMLRPESLALVAPGTANALAGRVVERRYAGAISRFRLEATDGLEVEVVAPSSAARVDDEVAVAPGGAGPHGRIWVAPPATAAEGAP